MGNCCLTSSPTVPAPNNRDQRRGSASGKGDPLNECYDLSTGRMLSFAGETPLKSVKAWNTSKRYVLRMLPVRRLPPESAAELRVFVNKLRGCQHPNVATVANVIETSDQMVVVYEYCGGGDVVHRLAQLSFSEKAIADCAKSILAGIQVYHQHEVPTFGSLRMDSFLFSTSSKSAPLKLVETGLKSFVSSILLPDKHNRLTAFTAPETLEGRPCPASDLWFVGVCVYLLLAGRPPFQGSNDEETKEAISKAELSFPIEYFQGISPNATNFIRQILVRDHSKRMTLTEAQAHEWLRNTNEVDLPITRLGSARTYCRGGGLKEIASRSGAHAESSSSASRSGSLGTTGMIKSPKGGLHDDNNNNNKRAKRPPVGSAAAASAQSRSSPRSKKLTLAQILDEFEANALM